MENKKVVKDSIEIVKDIQFKNRKNLRLDEYTQKLHL